MTVFGHWEANMRNPKYTNHVLSCIKISTFVIKTGSAPDNSARFDCIYRVETFSFRTPQNSNMEEIVPYDSIVGSIIFQDVFFSLPRSTKSL